MTGGPLTSPPSPEPAAVDSHAYAQRLTMAKVATIVGIAAVLYLAKDVFLPLSIAMLVTFALSPLVTRLRRLGMPNVLTVLTVVTVTFAAIALFCLIVASQVGQLAQSLPTFQRNIITKVEAFQELGREDGIVSRVAQMIAAINDQIGEAVPTLPEAGEAQGTTDTPPVAAKPIPVEVVETSNPIILLLDLVLPLISPIATTGLVVIVVIFMLLEREELRDRFIRLLGSNDLHRTTQVLEDAGERVAQYLLTQLLVNTIYAVPIAIGLWLIGVPNAILWGFVTLILRFVPYIGSFLSAAFPLFLAFAISPDWSAVLWTIALFAAVELVTSNFIEPRLYGSRTGVSPLAIIIAAIFWTWIWGPLGLVLSTPLTVCLVVLGRHVPQFEVFDIIFGDEPVLAPHARLYQRLLAGDAVEATFRAEEALDDVYLSEYYGQVGIPALLIAQTDQARGVLTAEQETRLASVAMAMVTNLQEVVTEELDEMRRAPGTDTAATDATGLIENGQLDGIGFRVTCIGARTPIDDVSAAMLAQVAAAEGAEASFLPHSELASRRLRDPSAEAPDCILLTFLDPRPNRASLLHIRRIKRASPDVRVGVVIWQMPKDLDEDQDIPWRALPPSPERLREAEEIGADFVATDLDSALAGAFQHVPSKAVPQAPRRRQRPPSRGKATLVA